ncbi:MAG TPA: VWA domain-containing protein [Candidatus Sulfotelmatobacter sp.]|nr:VWA domain-containing protein [Candidatus Sulfotelmatobacter sp.]
MEQTRTQRAVGLGGWLRVGILVFAVATFGLVAARGQQTQSGAGQNPSQPAEKPKPPQDIPDAPSAVQPPPPPKPAFPVPDAAADAEGKDTAPAQAGSRDAAQPQEEAKQPPPPMPPIETIPPGSGPKNQVDSKDELYKLVVKVHFVQVPVTVKFTDGRPVDGLGPKDFTVLENGKKQTLSFFTSDPFQLSVAVLLDIGMADVAVQKVNQTYSALVGAFSPYDEVALYTYSSTVSQVTDFTGRSEKLTAELNQIKLVRGHANGPPVLGGPLSGGSPIVNGAPVGGPTIAPVSTPPREAHVLNDAILRAALDLSKRPRTRRKVIFVISDGRDLGSKASYSDVLKLLETQGIQVKAVVVDSGALPLFRQVEKLHLPGQGHSDILPKYCSATGGGQVSFELSRNSIEEAYAQVTSEARNQYTLGYTPKTGASKAYRSIEVLVDKKGLKIYAKDGYYAIPSAQ